MDIQLISQNNLPNITNSSVALDTNVLLWTFYERITSAKSYQKHVYPLFIDKLLKGNNSVFTTIYNILEAFSVIENNEYDIYLKVNSLDADSFPKKKFRNIPEERKKIQDIISLFYEQIKQAINIVDNQIGEKDIIEFYDTYTEQLLDPTDFAFIKVCDKNKVDYIVTDDIDFNTYNTNVSFKLITGNSNFV